jgi:hypothetical protein
MPLLGRLASPIPSELLRLRLVFARLGISQKQTLVGVQQLLMIAHQMTLILYLGVAF